jgi:hypothetical protein
VNGDQLGWVPEAWHRRVAYNTARSQFWSTIRHVAIHLRPDMAENWHSVLAWTNLAKVGPWNKGNPPRPLLDAQRSACATLLAQEVTELRPRVVLALTGRWWFGTFADRLVSLEAREGFVEGVGETPGRRWVVAVHPQTRSPGAVAAAIIDAIGSKPVAAAAGATTA